MRIEWVKDTNYDKNKPQENRDNQDLCLKKMGNNYRDAVIELTKGISEDNLKELLELIDDFGCNASEIEGSGGWNGPLFWGFRNE